MIHLREVFLTTDAKPLCSCHNLHLFVLKGSFVQESSTMQHIKQLRFSHHSLNFINPAKQRAPFKPILQPSVVGSATSVREFLRSLSLPTAYNQTIGANNSSPVSCKSVTIRQYSTLSDISSS